MTIKSVLVCEYGIMREGLRWMLEKERDMEVVAEETHDSISVELVRETAPDVLIVYGTTDRLNGGGVINQILSELPKVKVMVIGVDSDQESIAAMLGYGLSGYLLEDCTEGELRLAIRATLRNEIYLTPRVASVVAKSYRRKLVRTDMSQVPSLTSREHDVLESVAEGKTSKEIASRLCLSVKTIQAHRQQIMDKLHIRNIAGLTKYAIRHRISSLQN